MRQHNRRSLRDLTNEAGADPGRFIADASLRLPLETQVRNTGRGDLAGSLRNQSILISATEQMTAVLALLALDGVARRILLCPPDLAAAHLPHVIAAGEVQAVLSDQPPGPDDPRATVRFITCQPNDLAPPPSDADRVATEWILFTSGTTGAPKMVVHTCETLVGPVERARAIGQGAVWSTFYDIRRYGGLQMLLRALVGGGSMVLSNLREPPGEYLGRAAANRVTHISGTPSHWRRALMSPAARDIRPRYVRMSGEVADQAIIDRLRAFYPDATVAHAFASTEAGVAFDVDDGQAGFPAHLITEDAPVALRIEDGSLRIRSSRTAIGYLGDNAPSLLDADGFVDTGDMIEQRGDRCFFAGRREGIINVGGLKVHPEEIEAVINRHPDVQMSLVRGRANPITGAIVVAEVVRKSTATTGVSDTIKEEILSLCRSAFPPYKVPASIRIVDSLNVGASGKLARVLS
jgi:acyl-coenzyme A synthetase/AMP-(fatty) acid ligase